MRFIDLPDGNALEDFQSGRGRDRENAVSTFHRAMPVVKAGKINLFDSQTLDAYACAHDICYGIERSHLVEMDIFHRHPMDFSFGFGDAAEDGQRVFFDKRRERAFGDQRTDLFVRPPVGM